MPSEWDEDTGEFLILPASQRARKWRWWFVLLVILGLLAAGFTVYRKLESIAPRPPAGAGPSGPTSDVVSLASVTVADLASAPAEGQPAGKSASDPFKQYLIAGVFIFIALVTFLSLLVTLFSKEERKVKAASDITKIGLGFFIGVATSYF